VTVTAVKEKEVPPLDDDFATMASEYDTIAELRADVRERMERMRRLEQGLQARDRVLDALLARVDVPLPESMVAAETQWRIERMTEQVAEAGMDLDAFLAESGQTREQLEADARSGASEAVKAQLVLDAVAVKEELGVSEAELTDQVVRRAARLGIGADEYAQRLVQSGGLAPLMGEIVRGKALALLLESAQVTDTNGDPVDLSDLRDDATEAVEEHDHEH
jgi:trigger factor